MDREARLREVIEQGSAEQARLARELLDRPGADREFELLYDAYLHDPYLTRIDPEVVMSVSAGHVTFVRMYHETVLTSRRVIDHMRVCSASCPSV